MLDGHYPRRVANTLEWARTFEQQSRHVAESFIGDVRVSTTFLGLDHNFFGDGPPLLFETMIFGADGKPWDYQERCTTWVQAEAMHARGLAAVHARVPQP